MSRVTTHVLDLSRGAPAAGILVELSGLGDGGEITSLGEGVTDSDGRATALSDGPLPAGTYRLSFATAAYFAGLGVDSFFPVVEITFSIAEESQGYHVPLLLSPYGYSTYRGS